MKREFRPRLNRLENYIIKEVKRQMKKGTPKLASKNIRAAYRNLLNQNSCTSSSPTICSPNLIETDPVYKKLVKLSSILKEQDPLLGDDRMLSKIFQRKVSTHFRDLKENEYKYILETSPEAIYQRYCFLTPEKE